MEKSPLKPSTLAAQAMGDECPETGAIVPPVHLSTTFARDERYERRAGVGYQRAGSPSLKGPQRLLAELEGGTDALLFPSGMAACTALFQTLSPGDHAVVQRPLYFGLPVWLDRFARPGGVEIDYVPTGDVAAITAALRPGRTRVVWIETPSNPTWTVTDIEAAAAAAHAAGAQLMVDSTAATPVLTRPLALGADMVFHSATKFLNGHSDVLAGAAVTARTDAMWERLVAVRELAGAMLGPMEAFLLLRGMRTLFLRVPAQSRAALGLAGRLAAHPGVERVLYPGLPDDPGHAVAARQMIGGFGGMLSVLVRGGAGEALAVACACRLFKRATSFGGVESLIEHRYTVEGADGDAPPNLLRVSIGVEDPGDLWADLDQALAAGARRR